MNTQKTVREARLILPKEKEERKGSGRPLEIINR